ncbi:N-acetyl-gamma-glutamyl-phosphate reductase [Aneurinibacillus thermoaerophilus]|uniref:N-acetyl-gamma-glutamyl-phosphate reductase n=1 Tax=Aneurinibacillus thermoaerophilus TaxID=143495 RepID=A0ABX8YAT7_ANETH|nr:N-acetyl-gamma-glutamyl-phosphate reductase [Aneurinibacillus thermoaerophilus]MED0678236.1 N-acetyl-gamma-glutamyl-phosphate reductase [Aneurinibacillus thermoaerophilus]MED0765292.1 N-acetyl-gamma-glutamyl-phosphate reductase [Aneurinibacillus thermoaerophilus]QYY42485.1 N-acetyl-gamma-glutamyl-phosphate reductase [Aneurinibacillus thermoaerophilus]
MNISIIGATGYSGVELIRLLVKHPEANIVAVYSNSQAGKTMQEVYPHLTHIFTDSLTKIDCGRIRKEADAVFIATPSGISGQLVPQLLDGKLKVIDVSGDFRLATPELYNKWYGKQTAAQEYLDQAVYGLSEWNADAIRGTKLLANPGCYPTATLLSLLPLLKEDLIDGTSIIVDAKSGVTGAGRSASLGTHFCEVNESISAYKVAKHQHTPEIEQTLNHLTGKEVLVSFTPHLVPMNRGILTTSYATLKEGVTNEQVAAAFSEAYEGKPFVRLRPGAYPKTKEVYGSNYCDIAWHVDDRTGRVIVLAVIDNVVKGAAGQAVQNMNLMFGLPETTGLEFTPVYP